jgi:hypothetical protein
MQKLLSLVREVSQAIRAAGDNLDQAGFFATPAQKTLARKERKLGSAIVAAFTPEFSSAELSVTESGSTDSAVPESVSTDSSAPESMPPAINYFNQGGTHLLLASGDMVFTLPSNMVFHEIINSVDVVGDGGQGLSSVALTKLQQERREALWRHEINDPRFDHGILDATASLTPVAIIKFLAAAAANNNANIERIDLEAKGEGLASNEVERLAAEILELQRIKVELASYERFLLGYCDKCGFKALSGQTTLDFIASLPSIMGEKASKAQALYQSLTTATVPVLVAPKEIGSLADQHSTLTEDQRAQVALLLINAYIRQTEINSTANSAEDSAEAVTINLDIRPENVLLRDRRVSGLHGLLQYMAEIIGGSPYSFPVGTKIASFSRFFRMHEGLAPIELAETVRLTDINFSLLYTTLLVPVFGFTFDYRVRRPDTFHIPFNFKDEIYKHKLGVLKRLPGVTVIKNKSASELRVTIDEKKFWREPILDLLAQLLTAYADKISLNKASALLQAAEKILLNPELEDQAKTISNENILLDQLRLAMGFVGDKLLARKQQEDGSVVISFWSPYAEQDPHLEFLNFFAESYPEKGNFIPGAKLAIDDCKQYVITLAPDLATQDTLKIIKVLREANLCIETKLAKNSVAGEQHSRGFNSKTSSQPGATPTTTPMPTPEQKQKKPAPKATGVNVPPIPAASHRKAPAFFTASKGGGGSKEDGLTPVCI